MLNFKRRNREREEAQRLRAKADLQAKLRMRADMIDTVLLIMDSQTNAIEHLYRCKTTLDDVLSQLHEIDSEITKLDNGQVSVASDTAFCRELSSRIEKIKGLQQLIEQECESD